MATDSAFVDEPADADSEAAVEETVRVSPADIEGLANADDSEAAAIAVAIAAHLRDRQAAAAAAAAAAEDDEGESRRSWAFAGRLDAIGEAANRPPNNAPKDGWTAAGRCDRF
jgi:predicted metal-dependent enzyme (double-stranded beta helix superfamily)